MAQFQPKQKLFTRYCKRCGILFKTVSHSHRVVCNNCNAGQGKILRVRDNIYHSVHKTARKYSKNGLILNPDTIIDAYQKVIKKFKLNKELEKVLHNGKNYRRR
jgi:protein-arginine kinase activator protein McsA